MDGTFDTVGSNAHPDVAVLGALTRAISGTHDLGAIFDAAFDALDAGLGAERASVQLFDADGIMRFKAWRGLSDPFRAAVEGLTPWSPDTPHPEVIVVGDVEADPRLARRLPAIRREGIRAMAFVPLLAASGVIGKFMLYFGAPRGLGESELMLARVIAAQIAFAVQRVRAEQAAREREIALHRSERHVRTLIDATPECVKTVAADGTLLEMNAAGLVMIEAPSLPAVVGRSVFDLIAPEHRDMYAAFHERVCQGEAGVLEFDIVGLLGTRRSMETHAVPLRGSDGQVVQLAITRDVTARKKAEAAMRDSEAMFRQLADSLPQIIFMGQPNGRPDYYNERWYEFTGTQRTNDPHQTWLSIIHPDDMQRCIDTWEASVERREPYHVECRFFDRRTGAYRWHLGLALPIRGAEGQILRWVGTATDIDDQKRAEQTSRFLAEASRTLSAIADYPTALQSVASLAVPDFADWCAVDVFDEDGSVRRLALSYWDLSKAHVARALEQYPSRANDPCGPRRVMRRGTSEFAPHITDEMLAATAHDAAHLELLRSAGLKSLICVPLKLGTRILGAISFLTSDSGRRYSPSDLALAEELAFRAGIAIQNARLVSDLQEADRQKDEFLATLAHELRNPLAPIRTALQLLRLAPDDRARRERAWDVMDRQLQQMVRLVDDLLDVSRITRGKVELQRETCELAPVVQAAVETSRPAIEAGRHELVMAFPPDAVEVDADPTRLAQVFSNLLNNAAKYTPQGGRITIAVETAGSLARVRVADTGIGIPLDMLTAIFDMFTQVDRSLEKTHGGLGIGLTLSKRLVEMHGGTIVAHSDGAGAGSEFVVSLPVRAVRAPATAAPGARPLQVGDRLAFGGRRVLVVDDNRDAAECLADMLRLKGHHVETAHDGLSALERAPAFQPDVVLLDIGMPRLSGYDTARRLRDEMPRVLLVAVTGWGQEEHRRRSKEVGFDHHLVKPVDPETIEALFAPEFDRT